MAGVICLTLYSMAGGRASKYILTTLCKLVSRILTTLCRLVSRTPALGFDAWGGGLAKVLGRVVELEFYRMRGVFKRFHLFHFEGDVSVQLVVTEDIALGEELAVGI